MSVSGCLFAWRLASVALSDARPPVALKSDDQAGSKAGALALGKRGPLILGDARYPGGGINHNASRASTHTGSGHERDPRHTGDVDQRSLREQPPPRDGQVDRECFLQEPRKASQEIMTRIVPLEKC